ncbi:hypothetical protein SLEP1_g24886 [Rubroshorea leprosula]|uniref:Uncharacterized protein n=1 Tax=Rubroshorea leprosula TaxID=152421 RepID=A0AAV5JRJ8_9ROSI|nr:hypothetical protein SLEP1_g24886 [Rubroshorea leprosula]
MFLGIILVHPYHLSEPNRSLAAAVLDKDVFGFQTLLHIMQMTRTWDSTMSMIPKGGESIWGGLDWSPEGGFNSAGKKLENNYTYNQNADESFANTKNVNYGRIISFGKDVAELHSCKFERVNFRLRLGCSHVIVYYQRGAVKGNDVANTNRSDVWTEYHKMGFGGIRAVADNKVYAAESILDLLLFVVPKLMAKGVYQTLQTWKYIQCMESESLQKEHMSTN